MIAYFTADTLHFAAIVIAGAFMVLAHAALARSLTQERTLPPLVRFIALFPPFTPLLAFTTGRLLGGLAWVAMATVYVVVRMLR